MSGSFAAWVPPEVLVIALTTAVGLLYKLVLERAKKTEQKLEAISAALHEIDKKFVDSATRTMLGSMGDRLDGRITTIAQELAVLKAVAERKS